MTTAVSAMAVTAVAMTTVAVADRNAADVAGAMTAGPPAVRNAPLFPQRHDGSAGLDDGPDDGGEDTNDQDGFHGQKLVNANNIFNTDRDRYPAAPSELAVWHAHDT
jgi:hypothetical protein